MPISLCVLVVADRLDSTYVKAYYRRGSANMALAKFKLAVKDFRKARKQQQQQGLVSFIFMLCVCRCCFCRRWRRRFWLLLSLGSGGIGGCRCRWLLVPIVSFSSVSVLFGGGRWTLSVLYCRWRSRGRCCYPPPPRREQTFSTGQIWIEYIKR